MEVAADTLAEEWKGYVWISGRNDKQSFPIKQGVLTHGRGCLLLSKGIVVIDQGDLERGRTSLLEDALWMPISVYSTWLF